jgi:hypothetical protein
MRAAVWGAFAAVLGLLAPSVTLAQIPYSYTRIAITGGGSQFAGLFAPSVNAVGTASFGATLTNGGVGIFVGSGGGIVSPIAQTGATFAGFNFPPGPVLSAISPPSNTSAFYGIRTPAAGGGIGIFASDGSLLTTIAATGAGSPFTNFGAAPDINSNNTVGFVGITPTGQGVFRGAGGALTTIAVTGATFSGFNGAVSINNSGAVSFGAGLTGGGSGIFRGTGTSIISIAATGPVFSGFAGPSDMNTAGQVAFKANRVGGGTGIFRGDGVSIATAALSGPVFSNFGDFPSVTTNGGVAFAATLVGGGEGIFTGANPVVNKVIRTGDALDGSTVLTVAYNAGGMNDLGQLAFVARLADGRQGIYVATPVPEPTGILALGAVSLGLGAWRFRRRSKLSTSAAQNNLDQRSSVDCG